MPPSENFHSYESADEQLSLAMAVNVLSAPSTNVPLRATALIVGGLFSASTSPSVSVRSGLAFAVSGKPLTSVTLPTLNDGSEITGISTTRFNDPVASAVPPQRLLFNL